MRFNVAQLGFRERFSTEVNKMRLVDKLELIKYDEYDRKKKLDKINMIFIDMKEAFDSVNHENMINVLVKKSLEAEYINSFIKQFNSSQSVNLINYIFVK
jgi:hypothetical protein